MADLTGWQVLAFTVAVVGVVCLAMIEPQTIILVSVCSMMYGVAREVLRG